MPNRSVEVIKNLVSYNVYIGRAYFGPCSIPSNSDMSYVKESLGIKASKGDLLWVSRSAQAALQFSDGDLSEVKQVGMTGGLILIESDDRFLIVKPESIHRVDMLWT